MPILRINELEEEHPQDTDVKASIADLETKLAQLRSLLPKTEEAQEPCFDPDLTNRSPTCWGTGWYRCPECRYYEEVKDE